jgi:hypothetical protein
MTWFGKLLRLLSGASGPSVQILSPVQGPAPAVVPSFAGGVNFNVQGWCSPALGGTANVVIHGWVEKPGGGKVEVDGALLTGSPGMNWQITFTAPSGGGGQLYVLAVRIQWTDPGFPGGMASAVDQMVIRLT